jgi:hypothetical protein
MDEPSKGPRAPRPNARTFVITTAGHEHARVSRVDLTLDQVVADELADYDRGRAHAIRHGCDPDDFDETEDDRAIWEDNRLLAVIKPRPGGDPLVIFTDGPEPTPSAPALSPDQKTLLSILDSLGPRETFDRLLLAGPYQVIWNACQRLGSDAVAEIRRGLRSAG